MECSLFTVQCGWWVLGLFGSLVLVAFLLALTRPKQQEEEFYPYEKQEALYTPAERFFYGVLSQIIDKRFVVFGKVRLADVIKTTEGLSNSERCSAFNKIRGKHLDFIICKAQNLSIVGAIELDDWTHQRADRRARDEFVDAALAMADIPVLHVPVRRKYSIAELKRQLEEVLDIHLSNT
ncbi:MAG: DUF2726 domain-containing protein [Gammaproteobacteria bacterium]|nr:DUF2726 domain-containing protein [Gammaproteobacteria bacterium]